MSAVPVRTLPAGMPVLATCRSALTRATLWVAVGGRKAILQLERTAVRLQSGVRAAGPFGWAGLSLMLLAFVAVWSVVLPQRAGLASLQEQLASSRSRVGTSATQAASPGRQSTEFLRQLPTRRDVPAILGIVVQQASAANISLDSGSYEWLPGKDGDVGQYRITLPVRGSYPSIRQFIEKTLAAAPPVALDSLHLARNEVADSVVDAEISFVIYMGSS